VHISHNSILLESGLEEVCGSLFLIMDIDVIVTNSMDVGHLKWLLDKYIILKSEIIYVIRMLILF